MNGWMEFSQVFQMMRSQSLKIDTGRCGLQGSFTFKVNWPLAQLSIAQVINLWSKIIKATVPVARETLD